MIRLATISDFKAIELFDPFAGDRSEDIDENRVFVYLNGDVVCGFISKSRSGLLGRPYVQYLAVSIDHQRKGIASELLNHMELLHPNQRLFISTECGNTHMQNLLLNKKYIPAGEILRANLNDSKELYYFRDINT